MTTIQLHIVGGFLRRTVTPMPITAALERAWREFDPWDESLADTIGDLVGGWHELEEGADRLVRMRMARAAQRILWTRGKPSPTMR